MDSAEKDPKVHHQPIMEGLDLEARVERVVDGIAEIFHVTLDKIRKRDDGVMVGSLEAVDHYGLEFVQDEIELPEAIEWTENSELVVSEETEETKKRLISPKVAAVIGGATLAGAVAATLIYRQKKN